MKNILIRGNVNDSKMTEEEQKEEKTKIQNLLDSL